MAAANSTSIGFECDRNGDMFRNIKIETKDFRTGEFYPHFSIDYKDNYKIITDNVEKKKYYLYCKGTDAPKVDDGLTFQIPVSSVGTTGAPINGFLNLLQVISTLKATEEPKSITSACGQSLVKDSKITKTSDAKNLASLDVLFTELSASNTNATNKTVTLPYNDSTLTALQKAQYIHFISAFFNLEKRAQDIYSAISESFLCHQHNLKNLDFRPYITPMRLQSSKDSDSASKWDLIDGEYYRQLVQSSGGNVPFHSVNERTVDNNANDLSRALDTDNVILDVSDKSNAFTSLNTWLGKTGLATKTNLPFIQNKTIIQVNKLVNDDGYLDFDENAISRPDIFLMDLVAVQYSVYNTSYAPRWLTNLYSLDTSKRLNETCPSNGIPTPFTRITCSYSRDPYSSFSDKGPIVRTPSGIEAEESPGFSGWGIFGILLGIGLVALAVAIFWKRRQTGGKPLRVHTLRRKNRDSALELGASQQRNVNQSTPLNEFTVDEDDDSMDPVSLGRPVHNA